MKKFSVSTKHQEELVDITSQVEEVVGQLGVEDGVCVVFIPHTTAGVTMGREVNPLFIFFKLTLMARTLCRRHIG